MPRGTTGKTTGRGRSIKTRATAKKKNTQKSQQKRFEAVMREIQRAAEAAARPKRPLFSRSAEAVREYGQETFRKRAGGRPLRTEKEGWGTGRGRNTPPGPLRTEKEGWGYTLPKSPHKTVTKIPQRPPRYDI